MSLTLVFSAIIDNSGSNDITTDSIGSENIIIKVQCLFGCRSTWRNAGSAQQIMEIPEIGEVEGGSERIILGAKRIRFDSFGHPYKIKIKIKAWIPQSEIKVFAI